MRMTPTTVEQVLAQVAEQNARCQLRILANDLWDAVIWQR